MNEAPRHWPGIVQRFRADDGGIHVGGVPLDRLARRVGTTPFYAYSRSFISERVASLRQVLPPGLRLSYAVKANPMPAVVQHLAGLVDGLDVASAGEMRVALDTPMAPAHISFAGPGKRPDELARAVAAGVTVSIESATELRRVAETGLEQGVRPRVAVRVNPDFELKASGMQMGGGPKAFGIDAEVVPAVLREAASLGLDFEGFQIFAGSQNLDAQALVESQRRTVDLAIALAASAPAQPRLLNIGGGFGIPYFPGDRPLDLLPIGDSLATLQQRVEAALPGSAMLLELGRYLVGEAGVFVCRVVDSKRSRGKLFLITDGGLHQHLAASGNFGQVVRRNYPIAVAGRPAEGPLEATEVTGCLCTPIDVLGRSARLPPAEIGDLVVVFQSGAYGLTASPTAFLGHPAPPEVLV